MKRTMLCLLLCASSLAAQTGAKNGEWKTYGGDLGNTHYSPLDQITAANFNKLEIAWRFKTDNLGSQPEYNLESTPLMVNGIMYSTVGTRRAVVALDAATGELMWTHSEREGPRGAAAPRQLSGRGLAYWSDGREERILYVTPGYRLIALDAKTGGPVAGFGRNGSVDLKQEDDQEIDLMSPNIGLHATPVVAGDTVPERAADRLHPRRRPRRDAPGFARGARPVRRGAPARPRRPGRRDGRRVRLDRPVRLGDGHRPSKAASSRGRSRLSMCGPSSTTSKLAPGMRAAISAIAAAGVEGSTAPAITFVGTRISPSRPSMSTPASARHVAAKSCGSSAWRRARA